ncbi:hypothetical protein [Streptomyces sp. NPDC005435]|uniref:hypothetical protein n=1 Tax=Streptomyces sp. NPDC005435 TaxID=3154464 RepID=UPI0034524488
MAEGSEATGRSETAVADETVKMPTTAKAPLAGKAPAPEGAEQPTRKLPQQPGEQPTRKPASQSAAKPAGKAPAPEGAEQPTRKLPQQPGEQPTRKPASQSAAKPAGKASAPEGAEQLTQKLPQQAAEQPTRKPDPQSGEALTRKPDPQPDEALTRKLTPQPTAKPAGQAPAPTPEPGDGLAELARLTGLGGAQDVETGLGSDELALRRLLHSAVDDLAPRDGSLDRLRHAVPARRARKRQAAVGMAAAALFLCTAVPALVHVSNAGGTDPNTAMAGQSSDAQGSQGKGKSGGGATEGTGGQAGTTVGQHGDGDGKEKPGRKHSGGDGATGGTGPSAPLASGAPVCTPLQLGATGGTDAPDSSGVVYGTFRVTNTSGTACTVTATGAVGAVAQGAADPAKITAAAHVPGDAAAALPAPGLVVSTLVLQPGASYTERFGFVPSETCPVEGGATGGTGGGDPTPDPSPSGGQDGSASGGAENTGTEGVAPQLVADGAPADGSVLVTYTGAGGAPGASATVPNACAGTVYYTGMVPEA